MRRVSRFTLAAAQTRVPGVVRGDEERKPMNQHTAPPEWFRVVKYFKLKMHKRNRPLKRNDRPSISAGYGAPKRAKGA
jgi:hypothetical protein